jgi:hypothetical protein
MNNTPIDPQEQQLAQMLQAIERGTPPVDRAFLERLKVRTAEVFAAAPEAPSADRRAPRIIRLGSWLRRPIMNRTFRRAAIAAAVLIATFGGFAWWSNHHGGVAFADVVRAIDNIRSTRCTVTIKGDHTESFIIKMAVLDDHVREELPGNITSVIDVQHEQILTLMPPEKRAVLIQVPGLADAGQENRNILLMLRNCLLGAGGKAEDLGWRQINGRQARGFRADDQGRIVTLWADPDTALPLEVELPWGDGQTTILVTDFEFNPMLDPSLFSMAPPPGYVVMNIVLNLKDTNEQDLVNMLDMLADANGGDFPDTLAMGSLQYDLGKAESRLSHWQQILLGGTLGRAATFIRQCHNPRYVGAGVTKGEADRPVYWYRPKDSQVYRVIYGDLSIRDVPADQLPAVEAIAANPAAYLPPEILERNRAAIDTLRTTLKGEYPHLLTGIDLDAELAQRQTQLECARTALRFARTLQPVLTQLHNPRVTLAVGHEWFAPPLHENCSRDLLPKLVPGWHVNGGVQAGRFPDGIGYLAMHYWGDKESEPNRRAIIQELANLADAKALILDLRTNGDGGTPDYVSPLAGCFIDQPVVYGRETLAAVGASDEPARELQLEPNTGGPRFRGPVAVLIGPLDHGNTEWLALMMKQVPSCVLIGEKTSGMLGTDEKLDLGNGVTVSLPKYAPRLPDGTDVSAGVQPDIEVKATQADFDEGRDPVLDAALKILRE